jgi:hypothetical protein
MENRPITFYYNLILALYFCIKYFPFYSRWSILLFLSQFLELKTFYTRNRFLDHPHSNKNIFHCLFTDTAQMEAEYYNQMPLSGSCTRDTLILQSTLQIVILSVAMLFLFFCNSTITSKKNLHMAKLYCYTLPRPEF